MLDAGNDAKKLIDSKADFISEDRLLNLLSTYIKTGKKDWNQSVSLRKEYDAYHTACAILSGCDYMITTDDRLLKYKSDKIKVVDPTEFIREMVQI